VVGRQVQVEELLIVSQFVHVIVKLVVSVEESWEIKGYFVAQISCDALN
jgi:hypothetical protein